MALIKKGELGRPEIRMYESKCIQNFPPACMAECPMHVDVKSMAEAACEGNFDLAKKIFQRAVVFPEIISWVCDRPCQGKCIREEIGGTILISKLERAAMEYGKSTPKAIKPFKSKEERIAIIGAGLDGLAAALFLYEKGYKVTIFEKTHRLGGRIGVFEEAGKLPMECIHRDFAIFFHGDFDLRFNHHVTWEELEVISAEFNAVYDTVYDPNALPCHGNYEEGRLESEEGIIIKLAKGRSAGITLDRMMGNVSLSTGREGEGPRETQLFVQLAHFTPCSSESTEDDRLLSKEAARSEAQRCIRCECMECVKECKFLESMKGYPQKYVREIANNLNVNVGIRQSKNMVNSCTFCGLCEKICPHGLDMGEVCMTAKVGLVNRNAMPSTMHDFPIRDMVFSNSEYAAMWKHQPGKSQSKYVFFPGCQLAALQPEHIEKAYAILRQELEGGVGLGLGCCGAPAYWAGRIQFFEGVVGQLQRRWEEMGCPIILTGCSGCMKILQEEIPEMKIQSIWEIFDGCFQDEGIAGKKGVVSLHDACNAREESATQNAVRSLIRKKGFEIEELAFSRSMTKCCGYGGLVNFTNKSLSSESIRARAKESPNDFVVYCAMCRENFLSEEKNCKHIFDLLFEDEICYNKERITFSNRQENRRKLKERLLQKLWGEEMDLKKEPYEEIRLCMDSMVEKTVDQRLILKTDIQRVIYEAEKSGTKMVNPKTGHSCAKLQPGLITYWVEYSIQGETYMVHKAYSHRLELNKEIVGNASRQYTRSLSDKYKKNWE